MTMTSIQKKNDENMVSEGVLLHKFTPSKDKKYNRMSTALT